MTLQEWAQKVAQAAPKLEVMELGPWLGSMRSVSSEQVPMDYLASPSQTPALDFLFVPQTPTKENPLGAGFFRRRNGQSVKFDTIGSLVGLLPATWNDEPAASSGGARGRQNEEFLSDSVTDNIPTTCTLATREVTPSGALDIGRFSNFWWRDQVNNQNRTLCDDYNTTDTYPAPGTIQYYRVIPLWYDSGDGGITRGVTEYLRRFLVSGSRRFQKVRGQWYFPSFYGTPSRWNGIRASAGTTTYAPNSDVDDSQATDEAGGAANFSDLTTSGDGLYIRLQDDASRTVYYGLNGTVSDNTTYTVSIRAMKESAGTPNAGATFVVALWATGQKRYATSTLMSTLTGSFATYTITVTCDGTSGAGGTAANTLELGLNPNGAATGYYFAVDYVSITTGTATAMANRLIPSGPIPPTHAGTITATAAVTLQYQRPDADTVDGSWTNSAGNNTDLYSYIDETTANDADYIQTSTNADIARIRLSDFASTPTVADTVTIRFRALGAITQNLTVALKNGAGTTTWATYTTALSGSWTNYSYALTSAEIAAVSSWTDTSFVLTSSIPLASAMYVSQAYLELGPAALSAEGGWKGKDRFYKAIAYRFDDDSIWAPTTPRAPNSNLTNGLDLVTIDSANPDLAYKFVTWNNLPVPIYGVKKLVLLRSGKIDSTTEDNLLLNPYDLRVVAEVDAGTTSYDDYFGDDDSLVLDVDATRIRFDHDMPNPARYNAAGAMRMAHAYEKGQNPCAIEIAPVGRTTDYDLNLADTSSTAYSNDASLMRLSLDTSGVMTLTLANDTGAATAVVSFASSSSSYDTIGELVDAINNTSCAVNGQQWRAQLCPNVSPDAATTSLCPHARQIASCVTATSTALTKAAGGLSKVAVGQRVTGTNIAAGTYVIRIVSDTELTLSAATTGNGTNTMTFFNDLGDTVTSDAAGISVNSFQRVIANSLPGFLYFNKTYLDTFPTNKSTASMTVASPGASLSAPNCFNTDSVRRLANRYTAPLEAGIAQGLAAVDDGFVVPFANKVGAIKPRSPDRIRDEDYSLIIINEDRGCCAWNTVATGNRFATLLCPDGFYGADLERMLKISGAIWAPPTTDNTTTNVTGVGDFSYEMPRSIAATAQDNDGSYASAKVVGGVIWVAYRTSSSSTHADRLVAYDFSRSFEASGLRALLRPDGQTRWGWSTPLSRAVSIIGTGRRDDGSHLYGWNDQNAGSMGDGRIDELETGTTDNGTAISGATTSTPWIQAEEGENISVQHVILEHNSPTGSTGALVWHRSYSNDTQSMTPGTSTLDLLSELKMILTTKRSISAAGYFEYQQASGSAREWRKLKVYFIRSRRLRPAS